MLEKTRGQIKVTKLRVILLLEVDFNTLNKLVFNFKLMLSLEDKKVISDNRKKRVLSNIYYIK